MRDDTRAGPVLAQRALGVVHPVARDTPRADHPPRASVEFALAIDFSGVDVAHGDASDAVPRRRRVQRAVLHRQHRHVDHSFPIMIAVLWGDVCPRMKLVKLAWRRGALWTDVDVDEMDAYQERWEEVENLVPFRR